VEGLKLWSLNSSVEELIFGPKFVTVNREINLMTDGGTHGECDGEIRKKGEFQVLKNCL